MVNLIQNDNDIVDAVVNKHDDKDNVDESADSAYDQQKDNEGQDIKDNNNYDEDNSNNERIEHNATLSVHDDTKIKSETHEEHTEHENEQLAKEQADNDSKESVDHEEQAITDEEQASNDSDEQTDTQGIVDEDIKSQIDTAVIEELDAERAKLEEELSKAKLVGSATETSNSARKAKIAFAAGLLTLACAACVGVYYFRSVHRNNYMKFQKRIEEARLALIENHSIHYNIDYKSVDFELSNTEANNLLTKFKNQLITRDVLMAKLEACNASIKLFYKDGSDTAYIPFKLVDSIANYNIINNIAQYVIDKKSAIVLKKDNELTLSDVMGRLDVLQTMTDSKSLKKYFETHKQITVSPLDINNKEQCKQYRYLYVILNTIPSLYYVYVIAPEVFAATTKSNDDKSALFVGNIIQMLGVQLIETVKKYAY